MDLIDRPRGLIKDFIYVKDKTLSKSFCDAVIKKFDEDPRQGDGIIGKLLESFEGTASVGTVTVTTS